MIQTINQYYNTLSPQQRYNAVKSLAMLDKAYKKNEVKNKLLLSIQNNNKANFPESKFQRTLELLKPESAFIIRNEFNENNNRDWYDLHFSKTTYYKNRKKAIEEFLYFYLNC
ncbi:MULTISPECIES: MG284/MPN403 family protein [unclassified Mycoplasma]|uniref:MG284/MPN403 family protein n=1 Tax=unclassified Mycoplasma TaxID=2683645 RepID=UPI00216AC2F4|nr:MULTISPECIES: hypothetical protein [unclassified Mycoplasma]MCS4536977.1 hypothetical protein [Mycoplasma sp. CSL7475-4]MCT4469508.1 hypothetical protein [Mycoplasma sp. HS2188]